MFTFNTRQLSRSEAQWLLTLLCVTNAWDHFRAEDVRLVRYELAFYEQAHGTGSLLLSTVWERAHGL